MNEVAGMTDELQLRGITDQRPEVSRRLGVLDHCENAQHRCELVA